MNVVQLSEPGATSRKKIWGGNVERGRKLLKLSQRALAREVGVTQQTISSIERGEYAPRDDLKVAIATSLHQDVQTLFPLMRIPT